MVNSPDSACGATIDLGLEKEKEDSSLGKVSPE